MVNFDAHRGGRNSQNHRWLPDSLLKAVAPLTKWIALPAVRAAVEALPAGGPPPPPAAPTGSLGAPAVVHSTLPRDAYRK